MNFTNAIIEYENGELNTRGIVELFSHLINTGQAWQLQGMYGRQAMQFIEDGIITDEGIITDYGLDLIMMQEECDDMYDRGMDVLIPEDEDEGTA